jgi:glycosyltransferase involved in cell wall biosynthesis
VVLPSYYREGVPRILLEAAAMERPIITTDNVGCREVVIDKWNGFLCKPKDPKDLADKMEKMLSLPPFQRVEMGKRGRKLVIEKFDEQKIIDKYLEVIDTILKRNS